MAVPSSDPTVRRAGGAWVFHGGVPWDTPWLNDQQLAHALAAEAPVLYVEPPRSPLSELRRGRRSGSRARLVRPGLRRAEGGVHVLTVVGLPPIGSEPMQRASAPLLRAQVRWAVQRLRLGRVAAAVAMGPGARRLKGAAGEQRFVAFVSDWLEAGSDLLGLDASAVARASAELWRAADVLCVTSAPLQEVLQSRGFEPQLLPHGFDATVAPAFDAAAAPDAFGAAGDPVMVVAGRLNGRLDLGVLGTLADRFRRGTLFLVGPIAGRDLGPELGRLLERDNVVHVAAQSREKLPAYLRHADVLLVPYRADEWSRYSSPMKVWDYLYAGPPIVGQGCPPLAEIGEPLAYHGEGGEQFCEAVVRALADADADADDVAARRRALARSNTWSDRAAQLRRLVA